MTKKLESACGQLLGYLDMPNSNQQNLTDKNGCLLGVWYRDSDLTVDKNGKLIGRGNVLAMLLVR